jgi:hypothetical protein
MSIPTEYQATTTWTHDELDVAEQEYAAFRDGFATLVQAARVANESGRPLAIVAQDLAVSLRWMSTYQAATMIASLAVETASERKANQ